MIVRKTIPHVAAEFKVYTGGVQTSSVTLSNGSDRTVIACVYRSPGAAETKDETLRLVSVSVGRASSGVAIVEDFILPGRRWDTYHSVYEPNCCDRIYTSASYQQVKDYSCFRAGHP